MNLDHMKFNSLRPSFNFLFWPDFQPVGHHIRAGEIIAERISVGRDAYLIGIIRFKWAYTDYPNPSGLRFLGQINFW